MEKIIKAGFYISWYEVAQGFNNELRLKFYDAILDYYFTRQEPNSSSPVLPFFTLIKPSIEKDINDKKGGAPLGNQNAKKTTQKQPIETTENNLKQSVVSIKTNNVKVKVKDNVKDKVNVKVNGENSETNNTNFSNILTFLTSDCGFKLSASVKQSIKNRLSEVDVDAGFLNYCLETINDKYPDSTKTELNSLFVSSVLSWDNLVKSYKQKIKKEKKSESKKADILPPPETCSFCGTTLELGAMQNSVECPHCRESGMRTWWEFINGNWICNR